jgi:hypothetical protein
VEQKALLEKAKGLFSNIDLRERKVMVGGGFFESRSAGGDSKKNWYRTTAQTSDFFTLVRLTAWVRMCRSGFTMRNFLSTDG